MSSHSNRPSFNAAWTAFMRLKLPVQDVGALIGGLVEKNINNDPKSGGFANACPIRMSYVLKKTGFPVRKSSRFHSVSGSDGQQYLYRIPEMMAYLRQAFGKPDKHITKSPRTADFAGMQGVIIVKGHGWRDAKGHVTLCNGYACSDTCHLMNDPENGSFTPDEAAIWVLR